MLGLLMLIFAVSNALTGLALDSRVPDAKTIWLFREQLGELGLEKKLFEKFDHYLRDGGFTARKGQIVDASIIAAAHDSQVLEGLRDKDNSSRDFYAESAYRSAEHAGQLNELGYRAHLQHKGCKNRKLTEWEKRGNRTRAKIRARIEHVFGVQAQKAGTLIIRTSGIARAEIKIGLRNLAYNMQRLGAMTATA
jgi:IS5 family transposase